MIIPSGSSSVPDSAVTVLSAASFIAGTGVPTTDGAMVHVPRLGKLFRVDSVGTLWEVVAMSMQQLRGHSHRAYGAGTALSNTGGGGSTGVAIGSGAASASALIRGRMAIMLANNAIPAGGYRYYNSTPSGYVTSSKLAVEFGFYQAQDLVNSRHFPGVVKVGTTSPSGLADAGIQASGHPGYGARCSDLDGDGGVLKILAGDGSAATVVTSTGYTLTTGVVYRVELYGDQPAGRVYYLLFDASSGELLTSGYVAWAVAASVQNGNWAVMTEGSDATQRRLFLFDIQYGFGDPTIP